jgi:hypothetical protein
MIKTLTDQCILRYASCPKKSDAIELWQLSNPKHMPSRKLCSLENIVSFIHRVNGSIVM